MPDAVPENVARRSLPQAAVDIARYMAAEDSGRQIQFKAPRTLEEASATIAAALRRFVGDVRLHCERTKDGDFYSPVFLESLADRWEEVDAACALPSLFLPSIESDDAWTMVPFDDRGGQVIGLKPGPLRDLHDTIAAIGAAPAIPARQGNRPMLFSGATILRLEALANRLCPPRAIVAAPVGRLLKSSVVMQLFPVDSSTIRRAMKNGRLTDHRAPGHAKNAPLLVDENEAERLWQRRTPVGKHAP